MAMREWLETVTARDWYTETTGTVRFALIGLGWWTTDMAIPAIKTLEHATVTTLVSSSIDKAKRLATTHDIEHALTYDTFQAGDKATAYDAVYIATPNVFHLPYAQTAAALDKAVLVEKPMEATVDRAEKLVAVCADADVPLMVAYRMQTDPVVRRARELITDGAIGDPVSVHGHNSQPLLEMIPNEDQWRLDPERSGYGTSVMDLGIYSLNTARFLLERDPVWVAANMSSLQAAFADVPDERASAILTLEDNIHMVTTSSQNAQSHSALTIVGTDGMIKLAPAFHGEVTLHVTIDDVSTTVSHETTDAQREMQEVFAYFTNRLLTNQPIHPDGQHGLVDLRTIKALHEAAATGQPVEL